MDEYIVGQTYFFEGTPYTYKGGDPSVRANWQTGATAAKKKPGIVKTVGLNALQGLTANFADEAIGTLEGMVRPGMTMEEGRAKHRAIVEETKEARPILSAASNIAGLLVPASAAGKVIAGLGGLGARMAASGAAAGAGGLLMGAGEAEGSIPERLGAGKGEAVVSGLLGVAFPPAAAAAVALPRVTGSAGTRVAKELERTTGIARDVNEALQRIDRNISNVRNQAYKPLQETFASIDDKEILSLLRSPSMRQHANAVRPGMGRKVRPSLDDLQKLRSRLGNGRNADRDLHKQLDDMMKAKLTGLPEADAAYLAAQNAKRALKDGRQSLNMNAQDITRRMEGATPEVREAFMTGRLYRIVAKLEERDSNAPNLLRTFLDAGPETRARLRTMFPSDEAFGEFETVLRREKNAQKIATTAKRLMIPLAVAGAGGVGYAAMRGGSGGQ